MFSRDIGLARQRISESGLDTCAISPASIQGLHQQTLEATIQCHYCQFICARENLLYDGSSQYDSYTSSQLICILGMHCMLRQRLNNRAHISDMNAFHKQIL